MEKITKEDMDKLYEYLDKTGANYTVEKDPSPETVEKIRKQIEAQEKRLKQMKNKYNEQSS